MYQELKWKVQEEYNNYVELDQSCELSEDELAESFCSGAIVKYNDSHRFKLGFVINNGIIEIIEV